jgi:uncharacterized membrane protein
LIAIGVGQAMIFLGLTITFHHQPHHSKDKNGDEVANKDVEMV